MIAGRTLVVVGNGMVGHRFCEELVARGLHQAWNVVVVGEEPRPAYDRVHLSELVGGRSAEELSLLSEPGWYHANGVTLLTNERVIGIDRAARTLALASGTSLAYDRLVLATGSFPFVPPIPGRDGPGCFVYRTIEDLQAIQAWAAGRRSGVVVGGGLLGLEAANALRSLGLAVTVVEAGPRLMGLQVDANGAVLLKRKVEALGVAVRLNAQSKLIARDDQGLPTRLEFSEGEPAPADIVVFSAGVRPRDELAKACGLPIGPRGGVVVDETCTTADPAISAIGEVACWKERTYGLVAPGYHMARVAAAAIAGEVGAPVLGAFDLSTKLKLLGVEVGSFGDALATTPGCHVLAWSDSADGIYRTLVLSPDRTRLLGGVLVGDTGRYAQLHQTMLNGLALPKRPETLIVPEGLGGAPAGGGTDALPDSAAICSCHNVAKGAICTAIRGGCSDVGAVKKATKAGTGCGSCVPLLKDLVTAEQKRAGVAVADHLCEHFPRSRQELFHLVRVHGIRTFDELLARHGRGRGCEICKPAVASILASCWNEHVLAAEHLHLQDTNDRFLANIQRDGTYSVVPRCPGGEITPDQLIAIGRIAKEYDLYSKITGGQRIDLFGARLEQLPAIWEALIAAGFESGHAYGKALRTVKSCVGTTWCRYGVQDSVGLAVTMENRYKGLRSPHKLKSACSGCARECAEAQGKDFGVIATERGYNLHVCGNGGMKPAHGPLLAADLSEEQVLRYLDRFLMFYIRTADRLERTSVWFAKLEGGIEYLRAVVIEDSLGIAAELEADMQRIVDTYQCEWTSVLADPAKRRQFRAFVNSDAADPSIVHLPDRAQKRVASYAEKRDLIDALAAER